MSSHKIDLHNARKEPFNPKSLLLCVIDELQPLLENKQLFVTCIAEGCADEIITDSNSLYQILNTLLCDISANMSQGEIEVLMESDFCEPDNLLLMIRATKWLIPEAKLSKLFAIKGSDLGRVKSLVQRLGGSIKAENGIGKGTAFVIFLPVKYLIA
jgi:hypothetical protein